MLMNSPLMLRLTLCIVVLLIPFTNSKGQSHPDSLLIYKNKEEKWLPVKNRKQFGIRQQQIRKGMEAGMGALPSRHGLAPVQVTFTDSLIEQTYTRYSVNLLVAPNEWVSAYFYVPTQAHQRKSPAMLALHETDMIGKKSVDGQGKNPNLAYAKELAQRGYVVIAPDYPSFGDSKDYDFKKDRYESGTMKGIFNHIRCIDFLATRKEVDPKRVGVIGHSLGGHNAMFVGAFDERLKVVVSSCGWTLFDFYNIGEAASKYYGGRLGPYAQERYMPLLRETFHLEADRMPFDFDEIIAAIAPRAFFSNSPEKDSNFDVKGVKKGIISVQKVYHFLKADDHLQVRYPDSGHDFPPAVRQEAYQFIDTILKHTP